MNNNIILEVKKIIPLLYLVGGSVRDMLLNKEPKDYDFCTPLLPEEIENLIRQSGKKPYLTGKRFGTIGVRIDGQLVEITTFRCEKYAEGNRKPDVQFVNDLNEDLSRRDFTINAIAFDGEKVIDPFGGQEDLNNKVIRCVGKPNDRFKEDPLRMLRAARFSSKLGFVIDKELEESVKQLNYKILEISKERWVMELDKILISDNPEVGLNFLIKTKLMNYMIPELSFQVGYDQNNPHHSLLLWEHTLEVVKNTSKDIELRWAALIHDIAKPFVRTENAKGYSNYIKHDLLSGEFVIRLALYLKWSNQRRENVYNLVVNHMTESSPLRKADTEAK
jgi:tRNA nucleotidyltransferase (CCA-adding enzyme)